MEHIIENSRYGKVLHHMKVWFSLMLLESQLEHRVILSLNSRFLIPTSITYLVKLESAFEQ